MIEIYFKESFLPLRGNSVCSVCFGYGQTGTQSSEDRRVGCFTTQHNKHTVVLFTYSINLPLKSQLLIDDGAKILILVHIT